jgi:hypothetical protein
VCLRPAHTKKVERLSQKQNKTKGPQKDFLTHLSIQLLKKLPTSLTFLENILRANILKYLGNSSFPS